MSKPEYYPRRGLVAHNLDPALPPVFHLGTLPEASVVFDFLLGHRHTGVDSRQVLHANLGGIGADDHHPQAHTLASHTTEAHAELTGVGADDHHPQVHGHADHTNRTRQFFVDSLAGSSMGDALYWWDNGGEHAGFRLQDTFVVGGTVETWLPADFVSIVHLHPVVGPHGTGNMRWIAFCNFCADGELYNAHSNVSAQQTTAVTNNRLSVLPDMSALLAGVTINDLIGLGFQRQGNDVLDTVDEDVILLGWLIEYTADM